jgi:hypothetical protein
MVVVPCEELFLQVAADGRLRVVLVEAHIRIPPVDEYLRDGLGALSSTLSFISHPPINVKSFAMLQ